MDRIQRPKVTVLPDNALVPDQNMVSPPSQLTHEVVVEQPYYYEVPTPVTPAVGNFPAGSRLLLLSDEVGSDFCKVVDSRGLCVLTRPEGLRPLK